MPPMIVKSQTKVSAFTIDRTVRCLRALKV